MAKQLVKIVYVSGDGETYRVSKMRWIPVPTGLPQGNSRQRRKAKRACR